MVIMHGWWTRINVSRIAGGGGPTTTSAMRGAAAVAGLAAAAILLVVSACAVPGGDSEFPSAHQLDELRESPPAVGFVAPNPPEGWFLLSIGASKDGIQSTATTGTAEDRKSCCIVGTIDSLKDLWRVEFCISANRPGSDCEVQQPMEGKSFAGVVCLRDQPKPANMMFVVLDTDDERVIDPLEFGKHAYVGACRG